jgi:aryl carrier-like protein
MGMIVPSDGLLVGGRINDDFIKVNGRRIPASLIESKISELNDVQNCICLEIENAAVVFINGKISEHEVKNRLAETFTKYQLPDVYFFCNNWPINQNGKVDRKELTERFKEQRRNRFIWEPTENQLEKILFTCIEARGKLFGSEDDSLITFGWNSIELLSLANELNMKGVFVPLASFIQNPSISFILSSQENTTDNQTAEDPSTNDFDIDDILSVMNE